MSHTTYDFVTGDTGSILRVRFVDAQTGNLIRPFNGVYNASVSVKPQGGISILRNMNVLANEDDGYAEYQLLSTELLEGDLSTQSRITKISDGSFVSEQKIKVYRVGPTLS